MKILVCGGREYDDKKKFNEVLYKFTFNRPLDSLTIIEGGAKGADLLAWQWAHESGVRIEHYPADWNKHGKSAGHIRNTRMLEEGRPDLVIAFPGGAGTANMVKQAHEYRVPVYVVT